MTNDECPLSNDQSLSLSTLLFVRHAQASLFEADYDRLSDRGRQQSRRLGEYLEQNDVVFDEVCIGPRARHRQTVEELQQQTGDTRPLLTLPGFDEHHVDQLVARYIAKIGETFPVVTDLHAAFQAAQEPVDRQRSFARLFEAVARMWVSGECPACGVETWREFKDRVNGAIDEIVSRHSQGKSVLVVTSAGAIGVAMQRALRCPDDVALGLTWRLWNCSLTEFAFSGDRFSLDRFNALPHLPDRSEWTYR